MLRGKNFKYHDGAEADDLCFVFLYLTHFLFRSDAGDFSGADKLNKEASEWREPMKLPLAHIIRKFLGNGNSMSDDILDNLVQRSDILKELVAMGSSIKNDDRAGEMMANYNLLTCLGNAR